ncbi:hypothetical protein AB3M93_04785 [Novosphingobium panipatense]|jgi:hypothetical protein|uniref:DUF6925 family protein n=1 Tax=Novosphingobium TaxID=165696 RepID=UPI000CDA7AF8|nr:hypothetical protein [Novosphingobium sp. HII-3]
MTFAPFNLMAELAADPANGWSIGSFGAIGEFIRDEDEPAAIRRGENLVEIVTPRGAMRIAPQAALRPVAWDSLSSDGESWSHHLAFCCERPPTPPQVIRDLGCDGDALRDEDRSARLFDIGVGTGNVVMAVRTRDEGLIGILEQHTGQSQASSSAIMTQILRAQPHRVMLSPAGRIEVFQPIPPPEGQSPVGPHTHLLLKLVSKDRPHSSNVPIPDGLQSALSVHPRSPWRTPLGERHDFIPEIDAAFSPHLDNFGLPEDRAVEEWLHRMLTTGAAPEFAEWPNTRRGRAKARIVLRRLAAAGDARVIPWRALNDRQPLEIEEGEAA